MRFFRLLLCRIRSMRILGVGFAGGSRHLGLFLVRPGRRWRALLGQLLVELSPFLFCPSQFLNCRSQIEKMNWNDVGPRTQVRVADQSI
jgi:hypothetical protein